MSTSEKFCLKLNDFQENITAFVALRKEVAFCDVTLACEDGNQVEEHQIILAASSPFFLNLLKNNKVENPLIYMTGLTFDDLVAIVNFLYHGEAVVHHRNLDTFLCIAEDLDIKGLKEGKAEKYPSKNTDNLNVMNNAPRKNENQNQSQKELALSESFVMEKDNPKMTRALLLEKFSGDQKDLDARVKSVIGRSKNIVKLSDKKVIKPYVCQICEKEGQWTTIRDHVEANHLERVMITCNMCHKTFSTRNAHRQHKSRIHKSSMC